MGTLLLVRAVQTPVTDRPNASQHDLADTTNPHQQYSTVIVCVGGGGGEGPKPWH
jgi:hypothetical protein